MNSPDGFEDIKDLIDRIRAGLGTTLGTYQYKDENNISQTEPAIYLVENAAKDPPRNWQATGLECLIKPPQTIGRPYFSGRSQLTKNYRIRLIQHDRNLTTLPARLSLQAAFPDLTEDGVLMEQNDERDEQLNLLLCETELI